MSYKDEQDRQDELEGRKLIGEAIKLIKKHRWRSRLFSAVYSVVLLGTLLMAIVMALGDKYWFSMAFVTEVWIFYRMYLVNRLHANLLFDGLHHAQRALAETDERRIWHVRQLEHAVDMYNWSSHSPLTRGNKLKALLAVGPAKDAPDNEEDDDDT